eukprot:snap_masked-scaffold_33-processed-gene-3.40-mRNA-1 protein AED:1.00 eAED:1.00 QI:0/-1/0/0/-1/1/1/0/232
MAKDEIDEVKLKKMVQLQLKKSPNKSAEDVHQMVDLLFKKQGGVSLDRVKACLKDVRPCTGKEPAKEKSNESNSNGTKKEQGEDKDSEKFISLSSFKYDEISRKISGFEGFDLSQVKEKVKDLSIKVKKKEKKEKKEPVKVSEGQYFEENKENIEVQNINVVKEVDAKPKPTPKLTEIPIEKEQVKKEPVKTEKNSKVASKDTEQRKEVNVGKLDEAIEKRDKGVCANCLIC